MRLNKSDKQAFVLAVMADVPEIDFQEKALALVREEIRESLPDPVRAIYDDKKLRPYLGNACVSMPGCFRYQYFDAATCYEMSRELAAVITKLSDEARAQDNARRELKSRLEGVIESCTTLKRAKELLPEFEKYLPAERGTVIDRSVPVISNIVADLTAAGWPKGQEVAA